MIILDHIGSQNETVCHTDFEDHSPQKGKKCIFPWIDPWMHERHDGCSNPDGNKRGPWCPTKVSESGMYSHNSNEYGFCNKKCMETGNFNN